MSITKANNDAIGSTSMTIYHINQSSLSDQPNLFSVCTSSDFKNIALGSSNNGIQISNDYGNTWCQTVGAANWRGICCSSDFKYIAACAQSNNIWVSNNYGATFTSAGIAGTLQWYGICCSSSGQYMTAVVRGGYLYRSTDYGDTWAQIPGQLAGRNWSYVCCSDSGEKLAACIDGESIFIASNYGAQYSNWTSKAFSTTWRQICCSGDFTKLAVTRHSSNGGVYISNDSGNNWTQASIPTASNLSYVTISCSKDFKYLITGNNSGATNYLYASRDYGSTWVDVDVNYTTITGLWHASAVCGNNFIIGENTNNNVYIGKFEKDSSLYKFNNIDHTMLTYTPLSAHNNVQVLDIPVSYSEPWYKYALNDGLNVNKQSTGLDNTQWLWPAGPGNPGVSDASYSSMFNNNPPIFPVANAPINVCNIPNSTSYTMGASASNTQNYLQTNLEYFENISISFWIAPRYAVIGNTTTPPMRISLINISPANSTGCLDIFLDGVTSYVCMAINNNYSNVAINTTDIPGKNDGSLETTLWKHVVCTYNYLTTVGKIYVNTSLTGPNSTKQYGVYINNYTALLVGLHWGNNTISKNSSGNYTSTHIAYSGYFYNLQVFNREITQQEVNYLYNSHNLNISSMPSVSTLFKGTANTSLSYTVPGGGIPFVRGQAPFGNSRYGKTLHPYSETYISSYIDQNKYFAPCYYVWTKNESVDILLKPTTKYVFILTVGAGGGGACGNYIAGSGSSGGAGGGGGGGGYGYACLYLPNNTGNIQLYGQAGWKGEGGQNGAPTGDGIYCGGNGTDGGDSYINMHTTAYSDNDGLLIKGFGGKGSKHAGNTNVTTQPLEVGSTTLNNPGAPGGAGGSYTVPLENPGLTQTICGVNFVCLESKGEVGYDGFAGEKDPEPTVRMSSGGGYGFSALHNGFVKQSPGPEFLRNDAYDRLIDRYSGQTVVSGDTFNTFGRGSNGSNGEGRQDGGVNAAQDAYHGLVVIIEYLYNPFTV